MVFQLQFWRRCWVKALKPTTQTQNVNMGCKSQELRCRAKKPLEFLRGGLLVLTLGMVFLSNAVRAEDSPTGLQYLEDAARYYKAGDYFKAARYAFAAGDMQPNLKPSANAWVSMGLLKAGLPNVASYFFIRTLQSGNQKAIHSVLTHTEELLMLVGADVIRKYLILHTHYDDYDAENRSAYLYALGKDALLLGESEKAIGYFNGMEAKSAIWPYSLQLKGSALAILGRNEEAIQTFKQCQSRAHRIVGYQGNEVRLVRNTEREADDLRTRCIAGEARTLYQMERFDEADRVYDSIPKKSLVWPDILFEQAWNAFARMEYNRTLGKLVSYKSPALKFVYNSEIEVLRAQSYLALCLYNDANNEVNEFNSKYTLMGEEVKGFVETNAGRLPTFFKLGKEALHSSIYTQNKFHQMVNRFVRGPYFQNLVVNERQVSDELERVQRFNAAQNGVSHSQEVGFPGFLNEVLQWRKKSIELLGGAFVKNSLLEYYASLIDDYDKMAFIKLEMLRLSKNKLMNVPSSSDSKEDRSRGNVEPTRRDDQYRWSFNGEFWNDELGDYVFGLESECKS